MSELVLYSTIVASVAVAAYVASWFLPASNKKQYSGAFGEARPGEAVPRRNLLTHDLVTKPNQCDTLYASFERAARVFANKPCFGKRITTKVIDKQVVVNGITKNWQVYERSPYTWETFKESFQVCCEFGAGLRYLGLPSGDKLAIFEETSYEWTVAEQGCYTQNITVLTVYANLGIEALTFALEQADVTYLLTNASLLKTIADIFNSLKTLKVIIYCDEIKDEKSAQKLRELGVKLVPFYDVITLGKNNPTAVVPPTPEDLACIMYTSGSTGVPKGVMITHASMISAVGGFGTCFNVVDGDCYLNYLPLAHVLAMVVENAVLHYGGKMGFGNPKTLTEDNMAPGFLGDLRELAPTAFAGVPLVFDRIKAGIVKKVSEESFLKRFIFKYALVLKQKAWLQGRPTPILNAVVFNQFKSRLGGKMRFMVSGGAPLSPSAHLFLESCFGVPLLQGYGLTETCGAGTVMLMEDRSQGTVGPPVPCSEIKLVDCPEMGYLTSSNPPYGEVWIRGSNITKGYYKNPKLTEEVYTEDGWFKTGDVGRWNSNGTISIVDRIKNLVKGPTGEYIALEKLESIYKNSPFVVNACVFASKEFPILIAIVQPQPPAIAKFNAENPSDKLFHQNPAFAKAVHSSLVDIGRKDKLKSFELITHVIIVAEEWTPDNNLLTAAMKLNRRNIYTTYDAGINEILKTA